MTTDAIIYTTRICPYCMQAKALLDKKSVSYEEIAVDADPAARAEMTERSGRRTVPQIWIGKEHVGGFDDLWALEQRGHLDPLLEQARSAS